MRAMVVVCLLMVVGCCAGPEPVPPEPPGQVRPPPGIPGPSSSVTFEGHYDVEIGHLDVLLLVESYSSRIVLECTTSGALQGTTHVEYPDFDSAVLGACVIGEGRHAMRFNMPQYTFGAWVNYDDSIRKTFPLCRLGTWANPPCIDR